jgi:hypothetical protein
MMIARHWIKNQAASSATATINRFLFLGYALLPLCDSDSSVSPGVLYRYRKISRVPTVVRKRPTAFIIQVVMFSQS